MPPKKLKNQHKRAASIGLQTVTCCDACRGLGTWETNGREELMRAQFGLRCRGWGHLRLPTHLPFFSILFLEHQRMEDEQESVSR